MKKGDCSQGKKKSRGFRSECTESPAAPCATLGRGQGDTCTVKGDGLLPSPGTTRWPQKRHMVSGTLPQVMLIRLPAPAPPPAVGALMN